MPERIVVITRMELEQHIDLHIRQEGPQCDLNHIDVSQMTDMRGVFAGSKFNGDISQWDVSNVTMMGYMFKSSTFDGDISRWNVARVFDMREMFYECPFNGDLSQWQPPMNLIGTPFERWHPSILGVYSALSPYFKHMHAIEERERFDALRTITENLGMTPLDAGRYIYEQMYTEQPALIESSYEFT